MYNMNELNALWFSRHKPTDEQLKEIKKQGSTIVDLEKGIELGSKEIKDYVDLGVVMGTLKALIVEKNIGKIYGVFPTPILSECHKTIEEFVSNKPFKKAVTLYAAWNVMRTQEGQKPTFMHKEFMKVGMLFI